MTSARPGVVLDASVAVRALLSAGDADRTLRERVHDAWCHARHLIDAEVGNVLRRNLTYYDALYVAAAWATPCSPPTPASPGHLGSRARSS